MQGALQNEENAVGDGRVSAHRPAVLIAGPTASGKSAFALRVARALTDPLIVNCDSMQVYADLSIVTARPDSADRHQAEHALYGHRDGAMAYSAALWRDEVAALLADHPDRPLVFVGGTGLYFRVLLEGLSPVPPVPEDVRAQVRAAVETQGAPAIHAQLDAAMAAALSPTDSQRVARAMEVLQATGQSLADWQKLPPDGGVIAFDPALAVVLDPPRDQLEDRITARAQTMFAPDALDEVDRLMSRKLSPDLPVMRAIGVSALHAYLTGALDRAAAVERLVIQTRQYAKRQTTWYRGQMGLWQRTWDQMSADGDGVAEHLADRLGAALRGYDRMEEKG